MNSNATRPVDLVVVGAGPVGVATAIFAADRGLSVCVLERSTEIYDMPRAIVMDDEIQRLLHAVGLGDGLTAITTPLRGAEFVDAAGQRIIGVDLPAEGPWPLGHHPSVTYYQPELEAFLRAAAIEAGVDLRLGIEVTGVDVTAAEGTADGTVRVTTTSPGADEAGVMAARWVVAADGASSSIRKSLGVPFVDQGYDQDWLVLDVALRHPVDRLPTLVQQICDPARPVTFVVGHGHFRRWELQLLPGETREQMTDPDRIWQLLVPWLTPDDADLVRAVVYRFHATVAETMRSGAIFLAGDAAHQMPPFLGQGLCSGIRDSANLAWKLDFVKRGIATDGLLDTYSAERLPHASDVVRYAADTGRLIDALSNPESTDANLEAGYGGERPFPRLRTGALVEGEPAVGRPCLQPTIDGQPLDELLGRDLTLLVDEAATADHLDPRLAPVTTTVVVPPDLLSSTLPAGGGVLVRPDRINAVIANSAEQLAAMSAQLADRLCLTTTATTVSDG